MTETRLKAFLDRIEGETAVLLVGDNGLQVNFPVCHLPDNVEEGTVIAIHFAVDPEATREARNRTAGLIQRLRRKRS